MIRSRSTNYWVSLVTLFVLLVSAFFSTSASASSLQTASSTAQAVTDGNSPNPYGGQDYYVDATLGDDTQDGKSEASPWKTLGKVNETTFLPGDRILLKAGETWNDQQLWPKGSGSEGKPITIDKYGSSERRPYIATNGKVDNPVSGSTFVKDKNKVGLTGAVVLRNQQYWEIHNLELSNDDDFNTDINVSARIKSVVRDGISISINADLLEGSDKIMDYFRISNNYIHDIDGPTDWQKIHYGGIIFQVFGEKSYGSYDKSAYYFKDVRIENNRFYKTELHAIEFAFNWFGDSPGSYDSTGKYHEGWEQLWVKDRDLYSRDVYIGHNYAENIGQGAIQLANAQNMTVEYNEVNGFLQRYNAVSCGLYLWAGADSVMQYNEVYGGPAGEYDGTPWDLEYTNFNVTYQYNYSHDNAAGWMAYMGNSSNSIARYNLSVNDNGVLVKNMLSTNYSPTYFLNNVFVYDADKMSWFHDEVFKDTVYFLNNVFYNTSTATPTKWFRKDGALDKAVFSNNAFYEAGGTLSVQQPKDKHAVLGDPQFVEDPTHYKKGNGVANIVDSAANFKVKSTSPLIDAGRYNAHAGRADFFGTQLYYGKSIDIGIQESKVGAQVINPVDTNPIEQEGVSNRVNLALNKSITANYTHPSPGLDASKLVDGKKTTRWASSDPPLVYPIYLTIDFGQDTQFDEIYLDEYTDGGTNLRIQEYELQKYNPTTNAWETFKTVTNGMGHDVTLNDFGSVTSSKLRLAITKQKSSEQYTPTMTEIQVYNNAVPVPTEKNPQLSIGAATYDLNVSMRDNPNNRVAVGVDLDGDTLSDIRYVGTEGNVLSSLTAGADYTATGSVYDIASSFLQKRSIGESGLQFEFASGKKLRLNLQIIDSTRLESVLDEAKAVEPNASGAYAALLQAITDAQSVLDKANRTVQGSGNQAVLQLDLDEQETQLRAALDKYRVDTAGPLTLSAMPGDHQVNLEWSPVHGTVTFDVYQNQAYLTTVTGDVYTYAAVNLTNGKSYEFEVMAADRNGTILAVSPTVSVTPAGVPGAPTNVTAEAGNGQASIRFAAPADDGGSPIIRYEAVSSPGGITAEGTGSPILVKGLDNGTSYTFAVRAVNAVGVGAESAVSNPVIPAAAADGSTPTPTPAPTPTPTPAPSSPTASTPAKEAKSVLGDLSTVSVGGRNTTLLRLDEAKTAQFLETAKNGQMVRIEALTGTDGMVAEMGAGSVQALAVKQIVLELKTPDASYSLPFQKIDLSALLTKLDGAGNAANVKLRLEIAKASDATVQLAKQAAADGAFSLLAPVVEFTLTGINGEQTARVSEFGSYVERTIALPKGTSPGQSSTGAVIEPDGTVRHIPTKWREAGGVYYAVLSSRTNSAYTVISHPVNYTDTAGHWADAAIHNLGSRLIINGIGAGRFEPNRNITRAEFTSMITRALALPSGNDSLPFLDVTKESIYRNALSAAYANGIVKGADSNHFHPAGTITREEAMTMIARAMSVAGVPSGAADKEARNKLLSGFRDADLVSEYAKTGITDSISSGIVTGQPGGILAPKGKLTRAEATVLIERLLKQAGLI